MDTIKEGEKARHLERVARLDGIKTPIQIIVLHHVLSDKRLLLIGTCSRSASRTQRLSVPTKRIVLLSGAQDALGQAIPRHRP
jgi:hypothetical protein